MEAAKRYGTINLKGIYDKSSSILTEEESSSTGVPDRVPEQHTRKNLEPWETGQRKENSDHRQTIRKVRVRISK